MNKVRFDWVSIELLVVFGIAAALIVYRFFDLATASFIHDEPRLQSMVVQSVQQGSLPLLGLTGSQPLPYGPVPLWLYMLVPIVSSSLLAPFFFHTFVFSISFLVLAAAVYLVYGRRAAAWSLLLAASSPFMFYYSRLPWDNTFLFFEVALVLLGVALVEKRTAWGWMVAAIGMALALGTHLMAAPLMVALLPVFYIWYRRTGHLLRSTWRVMGVSACVFLALLAPYLAGLIQHAGSASGGGSVVWGGSFAGLVKDSFLNTLLYFSTFKFDYLVRESGAPFYSSVAARDWVGWVAKLATWGALGVGTLLVFIKRRFISVFWVFTVSAFTAHLIMVIGKQLPPNPHYNHAIWFVGYVAAGVGASAFIGRWQWATKGLIALLVVHNMSFIASMQGTLLATNGLRSDHFGTVVGEQIRVVRELCSRFDADAVTVDLGGTRLSAAPFRYWVARLPECAARQIDFFRSGDGQEKASVTAGKAARVQLAYPDDALSAELNLQVLPTKK